MPAPVPVPQLAPATEPPPATAPAPGPSPDIAPLTGPPPATAPAPGPPTDIAPSPGPPPTTAPSPGPPPSTAPATAPPGTAEAPVSDPIPANPVYVPSTVSAPHPTISTVPYQPSAPAQDPSHGHAFAATLAPVPDPTTSMKGGQDVGNPNRLPCTSVLGSGAQT